MGAQLTSPSLDRISIGEPKVSIDVVMPTYKKEDVITKAVELAHTTLESHFSSVRLIVVVDGQVDRTADVLGELSLPYLNLIVFESNQGKGAALRFGVAESSADLVAFLDADLDICPAAVVTFAQRLIADSNLSAVVGSKRLGPGWSSYPRYRRVLSVCYSALSRFLVGLRVSDSQTGLKVFRGDDVRMEALLTTKNGFSFDLELLAGMALAGRKIEEGAVELKYSSFSTVDLRASCSALLDLVTIAARIRMRRLFARRA